MKITVNQLRRIIKEEISRTLLKNVKIPEKDIKDVSNTIVNTYVFYQGVVQNYSNVAKNPDLVERFEKLMGIYNSEGDRALFTAINQGPQVKDLSSIDKAYLSGLCANVARLDKEFGIKISSFDDMTQFVEQNANLGEDTETLKHGRAMADLVYPRDDKGRMKYSAD